MSVGPPLHEGLSIAKTWSCRSSNFSDRGHAAYASNEHASLARRDGLEAAFCKCRLSVGSLSPCEPSPKPIGLELKGFRTPGAYRVLEHHGLIGKSSLFRIGFSGGSIGPG